MTVKGDTLRYYAKNAEEYAKREPDKDFLIKRASFISRFLPGNKILELGCGGGHDALTFMESGFNVTLLDGSTELAALAEKRTEREVLVKDFSEIEFHNEFDGVWASASLLHVPSDNLAKIFDLIANSLKRGGGLTASFKEKDQDWVDKFGRKFCGMDVEKLKFLLKNSGFQVEKIETIDGFGSDNKPTRWIWVDALYKT
ncbi:class I SAM-dependent methyltransferase [Kiloniella antarctica]|uniref:Class I SAM-dependent methyltransferase n=1 Tax=Kiloniella antarctica TaxID=1550907 RepID=A0ABW5BNP5_9PROT